MNYFEMGRYIKQPEGFEAFIPAPFPPPGDMKLPKNLVENHTEAIRLLGKLDGITELLPDKDLFLLMFIRKDASSSSQIEGTNATMMDAIEKQNVEPRIDLPEDVDDIIHYIDALNYGIERARDFPFSLRFIRELHEKLMTKARGAQFSYPGEFRNSQNWIGGTRPGNARFVPPPVHEMNQALNAFERFIHADDDYLPLIKAGLLHSQFETIHPFTDGNGRTGRMLITMFLWYKKLLEMPILYLSSFFKKQQQLYYEKLDGYHRGEVFEWIDFFLEGIIYTANSAIATCAGITKLRERDMRKIQSLGKTASVSTLTILQNLYRMPIAGIADIVKWTGFSAPGGYKAINRLENMDILKPLLQDDNVYGQKWIYTDYINLFEEDVK
jgi:Fic family protein